jgi:predicted nuclease of predicted toxin-antitoxin system
MMELGLDRARDKVIFEHARLARAAVLTKDFDFVQLAHRHGPPPSILWLTTGNTSCQEVQQVLLRHWHRVRSDLRRSKAVIGLERS